MTVIANNLRYDLSDSLLHFFRALDPTSSNIPELPEHFGFSNIESWDGPLSPFFLLRSAVRSGRIWATWSIRNGRRTIYGPSPAVCFTEMPIAAFVEASLERVARGEAISPYALIFQKSQLFDLGTRPVIYSLSEAPSISDGPDGERNISSAQLAPLEQYRYVTYQPTTPNPIDWTHEREWRWPLRNAPMRDPCDIPPDIDDLHGLEIDKRSISGIGAIVKTVDQADRLIYDILTKVDRGDIDSACYAFVLAVDRLPSVVRLRDRSVLQAEIDSVRIDLSHLLTVNLKRAGTLLATFVSLVQSVEDQAPKPIAGETGGCWLWIVDNHNEMTRALLQHGRVFVNKDGKYLAILSEFSNRRGLRQRQEMARDLAARLEKQCGIHATYFSVLGKFDADELPFYNGDELDNQKFYNYSDNPVDY